MTVRLSGMFIDVKFEQPENAEEPMEVTPSGMAIFVKLIDPLNRPLEMVVRFSGMFIEVNFVQCENA
jgi:hypothetical protein